MKVVFISFLAAAQGVSLQYRPLMVPQKVVEYVHVPDEEELDQASIMDSLSEAESQLNLKMGIPHRDSIPNAEAL